jgi:hypothetical protein
MELKFDGELHDDTVFGTIQLLNYGEMRICFLVFQINAESSDFNEFLKPLALGLSTDGYVKGQIFFGF